MQPANAAAQPDPLTSLDIWSIIITLVAGVGLIILAYISAGRGWWIGLAVSVGGLGGLVHEIAQSGGKILFFERKLDGIYIGSAAGAVLGAVAGLLAIRGLIINPSTPTTATQLVYEAFLAGMALKGVVEAAGGQAIPPGSDSVTPSQAMAAEATMKALASSGAKPALPGALGPLPAALSQPLGPVPSVLPPDI
jgi:hypothetical protein